MVPRTQITPTKSSGQEEVYNLPGTPILGGTGKRYQEGEIKSSASKRIKKNTAEISPTVNTHG